MSELAFFALLAIIAFATWCVVAVATRPPFVGPWEKCFRCVSCNRRQRIGECWQVCPGCGASGERLFYPTRKEVGRWRRDQWGCERRWEVHPVESEGGDE